MKKYTINKFIEEHEEFTFVASYPESRFDDCLDKFCRLKNEDPHATLTINGPGISIQGSWSDPCARFQLERRSKDKDCVERFTYRVFDGDTQQIYLDCSDTAAKHMMKYQKDLAARNEDQMRRQLIGFKRTGDYVNAEWEVKE